MSESGERVAVLGGAVSGLAAAHALCDHAAEVRVFERQTYDGRRVNCGEAINDASLVPLPETPENGFHNRVEGFEFRVHTGTDRAPDERPLAAPRLRCAEGYICDRDTVERRWAEALADRGVAFETGSSVTASQYHDIVAEYDRVVDATGQPSLTHKVHDRVPEYTGDMVALNATVEGAFDDLAFPRVFFEGYVGYAWSFPKSATRANVGIGWAGDDRPDDYVAALTAAAERNGFPVPDRGDVNVYTIPRGPSLDPRQVHDPETNVSLVGDAAGIANRYQGEGICQGIRSAYLLADLVAAGEADSYPRRLHESMRAEYRLAHLMRGAWAEHEDPALLARVAAALDGLTIDEITRRPRRVVGRVLHDPVLAARLVADRGMLRRVADAWTDRWEYARASA
jgi:digeranylgeranylglycerophospholipid reductase